MLGRFFRWFASLFGSQPKPLPAPEETPTSESRTKHANVEFTEPIEAQDSPAQEEAAPQPTAPAKFKDFAQSVDASEMYIPRKAIYRGTIGQKTSCPRCHSPLHQGEAAYLIAARPDSFAPEQEDEMMILGGRFGWFCLECPSILIETDPIGQHLAESLQNENINFIPIGLIDPDTLPDDPEDESAQIEIIEFLQPTRSNDKKASKKRKKKPKKHGKKKRKKR